MLQQRAAHRLFKAGILVTVWLLLLCAAPKFQVVHAQEILPPAETTTADTLPDAQNETVATDLETQPDAPPALETAEETQNEPNETALSGSDSVQETDTTPEVAPEETPKEIETPPSQASPQETDSSPPQAIPDPYFYVDGNKHSFLPEGGNCADTVNCQVSSTPIQDALNAVSGGLTPDDHIIYVESGIYTEDVNIHNLHDLILQGATNGSPPVLTGIISLSQATNISLHNFTFGEIIQIGNSSNITLTGTDDNDSIEIALEGSVEDLAVSGGAGEDKLSLQASDDLSLNGESNSQQLNLDGSVETVIVNGTGAGHEIRVEGMVSAPGSSVEISNPGGDVIVASNGSIDVSGDTGGEIEIEGGRIANFGKINANGQQNGGSIKLLASDIVVIGNDAKITANASLSGNGGEILIIGERHAAIASSAILEAKGGALSGSGGFIETSGYESFDIGAIPDVSAANGLAGEWLLDPAYNIEVVAGTTSVNITENPTNTFTSNADNAQIGVDNITTALGSGDVTLTTAVAPSSNQPGNITWNAALAYAQSATRTLTLNAIGNITLNTNKSIQSTWGALNINLLADTNGDGVGAVTIGAFIISQGGNVLIQGADAQVGAQVLADTGTITFKPSTVNATIGIGDATGAFTLTATDLNWLNDTSGSPTNTVTIGRADGVGAVDIQNADMSSRKFDLTILGGTMTFNGGITLGNSRTLKLISVGMITSNTIGSINAAITSGSVSLNAIGPIGSSSAHITTAVTALAATSTTSAIFVTNTGGLEIGSVGGIEGITASRGITVTAESPLRVSRAIRENAGGDITLTAGNNSSALGDNLTISADVISSCPSGQACTGKITGNAGDNINQQSGLVSAPAGVSFNAGLDGNADNGGGTASISGAIRATNTGATVNISAPNGITITTIGQITTQGGAVALTAINGYVNQSGTITTNGGAVTVTEKPPTPAATGINVSIDVTTSAHISEIIRAVAAALTTPLANAILTVASGQPVSLLEAARLGNILGLQLPDGNGASFNTGIDAVVTLLTGADLSLPSPLPAGMILLSSLAIQVEQSNSGGTLGEVLVSFAMPAGTIPETLAVMLWTENGWVEVALDPEALAAGRIEALTDTGGGVFVLVQNEAFGETGVSAQVSLSDNSGEVVTLDLGASGQVAITGGAGDAVFGVALSQDELPGNLPAGVQFISGMALNVSQGGLTVRILPTGESIELIFTIPEGVSTENIIILYWLSSLNNGQGGWQTFTPQTTPEGRVILPAFFGGTFVLVRQ